MCACVGERGGIALKADEFAKIYVKEKKPIKPKGSISVLLVRVFAQKPEEEDE